MLMEMEETYGMLEIFVKSRVWCGGLLCQASLGWPLGNWAAEITVLQHS